MENFQQSVFDTNTGPSGVANRGLTFVFDRRHPNWYIATKIRAYWLRSVDSSKKRFEKASAHIRTE
jgi:hypothetical protein